MIICDTRESQSALNRITAHFDAQGIKWIKSKLYAADYMKADDWGIAVDRKATIGELARNITVEHERFRRELLRCADVGMKLVVLVEQDRIGQKPITDLSDLALWRSPYSGLSGERVYRTLRTMEQKYGFSVRFCAKRNTAKTILEILE